MRLVYIAGPYTAATAIERTGNIHSARERAVDVVRVVPGIFPVVPHLLGAGWEDEGSAAFWYAATLEVMRRCDAVLVLPTWKASKGAVAEVEEALRLGLPVFQTVTELARWSSQKVVE